MSSQSFRKLLVLKILIAMFALLSLASCSETSATGIPVPIPQVRLQCTTVQCRTNATGPYINAVFTTSGCLAPRFGEELGFFTGSVNCVPNSGVGCTVQIPTTAWVDKNGTPATTIPSGSYSICGCIDFDRSSPPFENCDQEGTLDNVNIGASTSPQFVNTWN